MAGRMTTGRIFAWVILAAYLGVIFYLSHQPALPVPLKFPHQDKLMHFTAYGILGALAARALAGFPSPRRFWLALTIASLYGISDELHQSFVPGRSVDFFDWCADTAGGAAGALSYLRMRGKPRARGL